MTSALAIVRAAIPGALEDEANFVLIGRTSWPFGRVSAQDLFRAASGYRRAREHGLVLCDWCHNLAKPPESFLCDGCRTSLVKPEELVV